MPRYIDADLIQYASGSIGGVGIANITFKKNIDAVPTADVAPVVHAHWIVEETEGIVKCSNPACLAEFNENGESIEFYWNHCPNCGARMDEEKQE